MARTSYNNHKERGVNKEVTEIGKIRKATGMSQRKFAEKFHLNVRTLQAWEQGTRPVPESVVFMTGCILDLEERVKEMEKKKEP